MQVYMIRKHKVSIINLDITLACRDLKQQQALNSKPETTPPVT